MYIFIKIISNYYFKEYEILKTNFVNSKTIANKDGDSLEKC